MGRSTKNGTARQSPNSWRGREKKRCVSCRKRAKDIIDGSPLCRIHSPMREGFKRIIDNENKARRKERKP